MIYGYVRVSSTTQNVDRQTEEMKKFDISEQNIFTDKQSGKDFNRENYQVLRDKIKKGDLLIIKSIDRLGRNYKMILDEWYYITKVVECDVFVIDMPLLDTHHPTKLGWSFYCRYCFANSFFCCRNRTREYQTTTSGRHCYCQGQRCSYGQTKTCFA